MIVNQQTALTTLTFTAFVAHWLGDFVFQPRWIGEGRSKSSLILLAHVTVYGTVIAAAVLPGLLYTVGPKLATAWLFGNLAVHWAIDNVTSLWARQLWEAGRKQAFFVVLGLDQMLHMITLFGSLAWVLR